MKCLQSVPLPLADKASTQTGNMKLCSLRSKIKHSNEDEMKSERRQKISNKHRVGTDASCRAFDIFKMNIPIEQFLKEAFSFFSVAH